MNQYQEIEIATWERKMHYQIFREYANPRYDISLELDITKFYKRCKEQGYSITIAFMYAVATCANQIPAFRERFQEGKPVRFDTLDLSFTYLNQETQLLKNVVVEMKNTMEEFVPYAKEVAVNQKEYFTGPMGNDIYQFSSIPWISYTHISHTHSGKKDNAMPMFDWGKYHYRDGRLMMPFSIEAPHSFVDGIHMGQLVETLQQYLNEC